MNKTKLLLWLLLALVTALPARVLSAEDDSTTNSSARLAPWQMPYFDAVDDPIEGFNRCSWAVNTWFFRGIIYPLSVGYTTVIPGPVRNSIGNAGHNLTYPVRLVNNCFQGKWDGAWEETKRFGVNSTVGVAGLFDPATHWKIGRSDEDFGQTLGRWGSGPGFYLVLPLIGPSNGRDTLGLIADWPLDLCFWIGVAADGKLMGDTLWPKTIRPGFMFNDTSENARQMKRRLDSLVDPYQAMRTLYSLNRERLILDYIPTRGPDDHPDPTIGAVLFKPLDEDFADKARTRSVRIPQTGKKLSYSVWMQKYPAPLVCYLPGLGSYRLDRASLAYADMLYRHGYSVAVISNPFQKEFMERASSMAVPGYGPADCDDIVNSLKLVLDDVKKWRGDRISGVCLSGVSHGAYFTLMMAAREAEGKLDGLTFDRYVAVNPPVSLVRALRGLDDMFNAPLDWPAAEREERMRVSLYKALYFASNGFNTSGNLPQSEDGARLLQGLDVSGNIPLTGDESRFLIGLAFRFTLMGTIVDSQRRHNLGVLKADPDKFVRQESYREIRQINYTDYMDRFVVPYLVKTGRGMDRGALLAASDLSQQTRSLARNAKVRVQICEDDFLLTPSDIDWLHSTFGDNLKAYPTGGHLGNLHLPAVQDRLMEMFPPSGLTP